MGDGRPSPLSKRVIVRSGSFRRSTAKPSKISAEALEMLQVRGIHDAAIELEGPEDGSELDQ
jgi:hypothetical protein